MPLDCLNARSRKQRVNVATADAGVTRIQRSSICSYCLPMVSMLPI